MTTCIALLRGVNVGRAKRIAMADLRELVESLGHRNVRTLLNSGNVVFDARGSSAGKLGQSIETAIQARFGFAVRVAIVTATELSAIVRTNPLPHGAGDPARYLVAVAASEATLARAKGLLEERWAPEAIAVDKRAAYLWCAHGLIESKVLKAFERATESEATTRNWTTILKLQAAAGAGKLTPDDG